MGSACVHTQISPLLPQHHKHTVLHYFASSHDTQNRCSYLSRAVGRRRETACSCGQRALCVPKASSTRQHLSTATTVIGHGSCRRLQLNLLLR